jgi:hypothetical protein
MLASNPLPARAAPLMVKGAVESKVETATVFAWAWLLKAPRSHPAPSTRKATHIIFRQVFINKAA